MAGLIPEVGEAKVDSALIVRGLIEGAFIAGIVACGEVSPFPWLSVGFTDWIGFKVASGSGCGSGVIGSGGKAYAGGRKGAALRSENGSP